MTQLLLNLSTRPVFTLNNVVVHDGIGEAVGTVRSVYGRGQRPYPSLLLHGPSGTGKTHLLKAIALVLEGMRQEAGRAWFISYGNPTESRSKMQQLVSISENEIAEVPAVAVDDVHLMTGEDEPILWSLSNKLTRSGAALIMAAAKAPDELFRDNDHLRSRIFSGLVLGLKPPDDGARLLIMDKMARDRNLRLSPDVTHYLVTRKTRNVKDLGSLLEKLDTASLLLKRRITLPLVKVLEKEGTL